MKFGDREPDDDSRQLVLDLFTEIAILEHLIRLRVAPIPNSDLKPADFGVLNHFCRLRKSEEKLVTLAFCFQVEQDAMRDTVDGLNERGFVTVDAGSCVRITPEGRAMHAETLAVMTPEIAPIMADFSIEDLRVTTETLKELRRTFDNLPDR